MTTWTLVSTLRISAALVIASTALLGCSSKVASGNGGTGGAQSTTEDLFACNLPVGCPEMFFHLTPYDAPQAVTCAGELVTSGKPGVLLARLTPGGAFDEWQSLVILRGDGTAVVQTRERHCDGDAPPCPIPRDNLPWEWPAVQQHCNVVISSELAAACAAGDGGTTGPCGWWPWDNLANCTTIDELSCNDAQAILAQ